jgi:hypothetical protein
MPSSSPDGVAEKGEHFGPVRSVGVLVVGHEERPLRRIWPRRTDECVHFQQVARVMRSVHLRLQLVSELECSQRRRVITFVRGVVDLES